MVRITKNTQYNLMGAVERYSNYYKKHNSHLFL